MLPSDFASRLREQCASGFVPRNRVEVLTEGTLKSKTMANFDSLEKGSEGRIQFNGKIVYPIDSFLAWVEKRKETGITMKLSRTGPLRTLPHDLRVKEAILGAMLLRSDCVPTVKRMISPRDFYREGHSHIAKAFFNLGRDSNIISVQHSLNNDGLLGKCGGEHYLDELADVVATSAEVEVHCKTLKDLSKRRQLISRCMEIADEAHNENLSMEDLLLKLTWAVRDITIDGLQSRMAGVDISNVYDAERMLLEYSAYVEGNRKNRFLTGIHEIDRKIRGVAGGEVMTIIARAGSFKTAMLQNLLLRYVENSAWGAAFFSLEVPVAAVAERYHSIISGTPAREIEYLHSGNLDGAEKHQEALGQNFKEKLRRLFVVPTRVSIKDIAAYIPLIEANHKLKIGLVGVDYLGLMDGPGNNEYEIVSKLARDIKGLAKMLDLPVVLLSQVSRKGADGEEEIALDHGRGSGAIEEGADFVLGLWQAERSKRAFENPEPEYDLICRILKNRKGPKGSRWKLDLDPSNLRIGQEAVPYKPQGRNKDKL